MIRPFYATLVFICFGWGLAASWGTEEPKAAEWVPFVAKLVEKTEIEEVGGPYTVTTSGVFLRDKHGSWYRRTTAASRRLPIRGATDTAFLFDRVNHKYYFIDFTRKAIKAMRVSASEQFWFGLSPTSPQEFGQHRSQDKFLGKKIISGMECEGYRIHDPRHKGKYLAEVWYAPSLNYLAIEAKSRIYGSQKVTTRVEEIQIGKEPDPQYFRLPDGFKMMK
jgi:hypothetical protein